MWAGGLSKQTMVVVTVVPDDPTIKVFHVSAGGNNPTGPKNLTS